jgi:hypothetical protein
MAVTACGPDHAPPPAAPVTGVGFRSEPCNGVTDADVTKVIGSSLFTKVVDSDAGCFWQENTAIGTFGIGMGISTWWYRGSDLDTERTLEVSAGSIYVSKGADVVTWSIQTMNPAMLPDLCGITEHLALLSQQRVN